MCPKTILSDLLNFISYCGDFYHLRNFFISNIIVPSFTTYPSWHSRFGYTHFVNMFFPHLVSEFVHTYSSLCSHTNWWVSSYYSFCLWLYVHYLLFFLFNYCNWIYCLWSVPDTCEVGWHCLYILHEIWRFLPSVHSVLTSIWCKRFFSNSSAPMVFNLSRINEERFEK